MVRCILIRGSGKGLKEITNQVTEQVRESGIENGLCTLFIQHTSASLLIQENADPDVCHDIENWLSRLIPEHDPLYTHTAEGPDDMPAHLRSMLTQTSVSIPVQDSRLMLGIWQGIFLFEHRRNRSDRRVLIHLASDD